jgi:hypothetical protein
MITKDELASALPVAEPLFGRLQEEYGRLPETRCTCNQPGSCCVFLPEMTVIEALQWIRIMQAMPDEELTVTLRLFVEFFLTNRKRFRRSAEKIRTGLPF